MKEASVSKRLERSADLAHGSSDATMKIEVSRCNDMMQRGDEMRCSDASRCIEAVRANYAVVRGEDVLHCAAPLHCITAS